VPPILRRNLVAGQWNRPARTPDVEPPPPPPPPPVPSRFPGDTNPKVTRTVIWGLDEFDQDGTVQHASELSRPETSAGVPAGSMRSYFQGAASLAAPNGSVINSIKEQHARGRIAWPSVMYTTSWAQAADGRNNAVYDAFITWVEEQATAPVWFTLLHEPENQAKTGVPGSYADWLAVQRNFRARMTAYANAHGGVANYKWRNLAFAPCLTAFAFLQGSKAGGIDLFIPAGTAKFWDFMGVDYYVGGQGGTIGAPAWGANIVAAVNWCKARSTTIGIAEWGVNRGDPDAAAKMQEIWNRTFDGTNDIIAWLYYNSSVGSLNTTEQRWMLTGSLLTKWVALMNDARSVHFWDLKNPATGTNYARPAGV